MIRILFLLVVFLSSASLLHAQPIDSAGTRRSGNIVVTVYEVYRNAKIPVDSAIVTIVNLKDSSFSKMGVTNANGVITFRVPKGRYAVLVTKTNYKRLGAGVSHNGNGSPASEGKIAPNLGSYYALVKVRRKKTVTVQSILEREKKKKEKKEVRLVPVKDD